MINWLMHKPLTAALKGTGLSISDLADEAGVSRAQLFRLNRGDWKPKFGTDQKIRAALEHIHARNRLYATNADSSKGAEKDYVETDSPSTGR